MPLLQGAQATTYDGPQFLLHAPVEELLVRAKSTEARAAALSEVCAIDFGGAQRLGWRVELWPMWGGGGGHWTGIVWPIGLCVRSGHCAIKVVLRAGCGASPCERPAQWRAVWYGTRAVGADSPPTAHGPQEAGPAGCGLRYAGLVLQGRPKNALRRGGGGVRSP